MIWIIARREFLSNVITLRFLIGFVLCLTLMVSSTYVLMDEYATRLKAYDNSVIKHAAKNIKVFSSLSVIVDRPPSKLSFLCVGSDKKMGNVTEAKYSVVPVKSIGGGRGNPLMIVFSALDMILIVQVVLNLLVLLFAYNTISGERERGTLAQALSNSVPRHQFLLGKFTGGMMSIAFPLLVGLLASLIVVWFSGHVALSAGSWVRIGLVVITSFLYISVFFTLGLLISSLTRRSATSLVLLLFIWVVLVIIVPNAAPYIAKQIRSTGDEAVVYNQADALKKEMWVKLRAYSDKLHREGLYPGTRYGYVSGGTLPYAYEVSYAPKESLRWYLAGTKYRVPLELEYANRIWALYQEHNAEMDGQLSLARFLSRISPAWSYYNVSAILLGTGVEDYLRFMDQARRYRQELIDYAEGRGGLASLLHFTRMTIEEAPTAAEEAEMVERLGHDGFGKLTRKYTDKMKPFDDIPVFQYEAESISAGMVRALPDIAILAILNIILFMLAHVSFVKGRVK